MAQELKKTVDEVLKMPAQGMKGAFLPALEGIRQYGAGRAMQEVPGILSQIAGKLLEVDAARFLSEVPGAADKFMDILWLCVGTAAEKSADLKSAFQMVDALKTGRLGFNFDASDSPLKGHFEVSQGKLWGGAGLLRFKDQDIRYLGSTGELLRVFTGDLGLKELTREGHPGLGRIARPIMQGVRDIVKGKQVARTAADSESLY